MAITAPGATAGNLATLARHLTSSPSADSSTLDDAHFPQTDGVLCTGWKSVAIFAKFTGGTNPTWTLQTLIRAGATATTADSWIYDAAGSATNSRVPIIVNVMGRLIYPRISALTGNPTAVDIYVAGWEPLPR